MDDLALLFLVANSAALLLLPRRLAPLPLLIGACYMTIGQGIRIGPFLFTVLRFLLLVAFVRMLLRRERPAGGLISMDWIMLANAGWSIACSVFHDPPAGALVYRLGVVYNWLGVYFFVRSLCRSKEEILHLLKLVAVLLLPVALEMAFEQLSGRNLFAVFGRVHDEVVVRAGRFRAQGPFAHAILAGTVGATCVPFMAALRRSSPNSWRLGLLACLIMVATSASSGPILALLAVLFGFFMWRYRAVMRKFQVGVVLLYMALALVMKRPVYFLIAGIDLTGGSTGWHRAQLIRSSINHLDEWWFAGTDYTRDWMPTGVSSVDMPNMTDITSQYIGNGVNGGLPQMLLFMLALWVGFLYVGRIVNAAASAADAQKLAWALGVSLFAHAVSCLSVSYFDQSLVFLYMTLALLGSLYAAERTPRRAPEPARPSAEESAASPPLAVGAEA